MRRSSADLRVQRAEGLIQQQNFRLVRECARDSDTLLLSARKLSRHALVHAFEGYQSEQFLPSLATVGCPHSADAQCKFDVVRHGHVTEQRVVLEYEADSAFLGGHVGHVAAMQRDAAVVYTGQAGDCPEERAFAAATGAEQNEEFPIPNVQGDVVDDRRALIALGDLVQSDGHVLGILEPKKEAMLARSPVIKR